MQTQCLSFITLIFLLPIWESSSSSPSLSSTQSYFFIFFNLAPSHKEDINCLLFLPPPSLHSPTSFSPVLPLHPPSLFLSPTLSLFFSLTPYIHHFSSFLSPSSSQHPSALLCNNFVQTKTVHPRESSKRHRMCTKLIRLKVWTTHKS